MAKYHEEIKKRIIKLGEKNGYRAQSGDSQPVDIRLGKSRFTYQPDVIWKSNGEKVIFEIAKTDDWRSVAGELFLSSLIEDCSQFYAIIPEDDAEEISHYKSMFKIASKGLVESGKLKWGAYPVIIPTKSINNVNYVLKKVKDTLKKKRWIE